MGNKAYITKIAYALPDKIEENPVGRLTRKTGIQRRHICGPKETASDLGYKAASELLTQDIREKVDFLLFCTQSPDYIIPTTACILQDRLGLDRHIGALDFNLGCSGFVYGLGLAKGLIESGQAKHVLLITAETYSKHINPSDHHTKPLFGDGAAAALIESFDTEIDGISSLTYGTDGGGAENLIIPVGGMRHRIQDNPMKVEEDEFGNRKTNYDISMKGAAIGEFALDVVPDTVKKILDKSRLKKEDIDYYVFHQANKFMLEYLQQKCDLLGLPYWNDVSSYGNTVSASIPIALCDLLKQQDAEKLRHVMIIGFGTGLSWAGCLINLSKLTEKGKSKIG